MGFPVEDAERDQSRDGRTVYQELLRAEAQGTVREIGSSECHQVSQSAIARERMAQYQLVSISTPTTNSFNIPFAWQTLMWANTVSGNCERNRHTGKAPVLGALSLLEAVIEVPVISTGPSKVNPALTMRQEEMVPGIHSQTPIYHLQWSMDINNHKMYTQAGRDLKDHPVWFPNFSNEKLGHDDMKWSVHSELIALAGSNPSFLAFYR